MKKLLCLLLALVLLASLTACTEKTRNETAASETAQTPVSAAAAETEPATAADGTTEAAETEPGTTAAEEPAGIPEGFAAYDETVLSSIAAYSVNDVTDGDERMDEVIVRCGNYELTNAALQVYYRMQYLSFLNNYGAYAEYFGLSVSAPLSEQECTMADNMTWEQYFLNESIKQFRQMAALATEADNAGFRLDAETEAEILAIPDDLNSEALAQGYESGLAYLQESFGKGVQMSDYTDFVRLYYRSGFYGSELKNAYAPSDADITAYADENAETLASSGYPKTDFYDVNVRHILIMPEDADGDQTSTGEEWAAAERKADEVYALWQENPTEDNFAALAKEYTADSNGEQGGLYENVYYGQMVEEFQNWCFDQSRQYGDSGIVKTRYGYHIMFFVGTCDTMGWYEYCKSACAGGYMDKYVAALEESTPAFVNFRSIILDEIPNY